MGIREWFQERPRVDSRGGEILDLLHDLQDAGTDGDLARLESSPEVRNVVIQVGRHRAPSYDHVASLNLRANGLVRLGVEERNDRPVQRVDRPFLEVRPRPIEIGADGRDQLGTRRPLAGPESFLADGDGLFVKRFELCDPSRAPFRRDVREQVVVAAHPDGRREERGLSEIRVPVRSRKRQESMGPRGALR
jgi:hypothetical protein